MSVRLAQAVRWVEAASWGALTLLGSSSPALAQYVSEGSPRVFRETAVELFDALDTGRSDSGFELRLRLAFESETRSAAILREPSVRSPGQSAGDSFLSVGSYQESTQRLIPEVQLGLFADWALKIKMPVLLAHNRKLETGAGELGGPAGFPGESLFPVPFRAPTRSGVEYWSVGLDVGVMNQFRNQHWPNWVVGIEGRFNFAEPMRACTSEPLEGQVQCAHPADRNRNGVADRLDDSYGELAGKREGQFSGRRQAGVSRGMTGIVAHTYVSKRYKYLEPYSGLSSLLEIPVSSSSYLREGVPSVFFQSPPWRGSLIVGVAWIPWEQTEKFQRLSLDFRARGTYVSNGWDYSELFDALGSSSAASLREPQFSGTVSNGASATPDYQSTRVSFTGLTHVQQHGDYDLRAQLSWQAGRYVRFDLGATLRIVEAHMVSFNSPCAGEASGAQCFAESTLPQPTYRRVIDDPGHRFRVDTSWGGGAWVRAHVFF